MLRSVALAAILCGSLSVADAAKLKIKEFLPVGNITDEADGMAMFVSSDPVECGGDGNIEIKIHVTDLVADFDNPAAGSWGVFLEGGVSLDTPPAGGIQTNPKGNGHISYSCFPEQIWLELDTIVVIYQDSNNSQSYDAGEERLFGFAEVPLD